MKVKSAMIAENLKQRPTGPHSAATLTALSFLRSCYRKNLVLCIRLPTFSSPDFSTAPGKVPMTSAVSVHSSIFCSPFSVAVT